MTAATNLLGGYVDAQQGRCGLQRPHADALAAALAARHAQQPSQGLAPPTLCPPTLCPPAPGLARGLGKPGVHPAPLQHVPLRAVPAARRGRSKESCGDRGGCPELLLPSAASRHQPAGLVLAGTVHRPAPPHATHLTSTSLGSWWALANLRITRCCAAERVGERVACRQVPGLRCALTPAGAAAGQALCRVPSRGRLARQPAAHRCFRVAKHVPLGGSSHIAGRLGAAHHHQARDCIRGKERGGAWAAQAAAGGDGSMCGSSSSDTCASRRQAGSRGLAPCTPPLALHPAHPSAGSARRPVSPEQCW